MYKQKGEKMLHALAITVGLVYAVNVLAATVSWSPTQVRTDKGQNVALAVAIDPKDTKAYTVKLEITYPANTLEVQSFTFANNWIPLSQKGYDLIDNTNGVLVKTGGFPGGLNAQAAFGTIVFKAKKTGEASVRVTASSVALGSANQNTMTGLPVSASVSIDEAAPQQKEKEPLAEPLQKKSETKQNAPAKNIVPETTPLTQTPLSPEEKSLAPSEQTAAVVTPSSAHTITVIIIAAVAVMVGLWFLLKRKKL